MFWLILLGVCIAIAIVGAVRENLYAVIGGIIGCAIALSCFFLVPVKGYMDIESSHWFWTVDIEQYQQEKHHNSTGRHSTAFGARSAAESSIPADAYEVNIDTEYHTEHRTKKDSDGNTHYETRHYYTANYSYIVDRWKKTGEASASGKDKNPYEPERPYPIDSPSVLGTYRCPAGHNESYTVTGTVEGEIKTFDIDKTYWEQISDTDEFEYTKFRFGDKILDLKLAK